jgi:hypothetical protein
MPNCRRREAQVIHRREKRRFEPVSTVAGAGRSTGLVTRLEVTCGPLQMRKSPGLTDRGSRRVLRVSQGVA